MSFNAVEDAVIALLATADGLSEAQVGRSNAIMLSAGYDRFIVTRYAGFEQVDHAAGGSKLQTWEVDCILHAKWDDDDQVQADLTDLRQSVIDKVAVKPTLEREAYWADIVTGGPLEEDVVVGSVKYQREVLRMRVQEEVTYVFEE